MAGLFSTPKIPDLPPPVRMPTPNDPAAQEAQRLAQARLAGLPGRDSTDLTGAGSGAGYTGGTAYTGTVLGK